MSSYIAVNENPTILCAYAKSEKEAFKSMGKLMKKAMTQNEYVLGTTTHYDSDGYFHITVTMSSL